VKLYIHINNIATSIFRFILLLDQLKVMRSVVFMSMLSIVEQWQNNASYDYS